MGVNIREHFLGQWIQFQYEYTYDINSPGNRLVLIPVWMVCACSCLRSALSSDAYECLQGGSLQLALSQREQPTMICTHLEWSIRGEQCRHDVGTMRQSLLELHQASHLHACKDAETLQYGALSSMAAGQAHQTLLNLDGTSKRLWVYRSVRSALATVFRLSRCCVVSVSTWGQRIVQTISVLKEHRSGYQRTSPPIDM